MSIGARSRTNSDRAEVYKQLVPVMGTNILKSGVCAIFLIIYTCCFAKDVFSNMVQTFNSDICSSLPF